ncbi:hypothetical protein K466DRAFT_287050 [Polyporus arcularius HHB13444]|uniref:F-box domain-containing protein n=1 Tax=Polyporus arcularius HHB13444 TaxID=1314778 RepID=A0A5C3PTU8_9APHY|nr:hypothetical protein K466DRAFT_287050 [Polyporus arcularius HHB13444]
MTTHASTLQRLPDDILWMLAEDLLCIPGTLCSLASTTRRLRPLYAPILFSRCSSTSTGALGIPPVYIRPFVKYIAFYGDYEEGHSMFGQELRYLPHLQEIQFCRCPKGVPSGVLQKCLALARISSVSFADDATFMQVPPYPDTYTPCLHPVLKLAYNVPTWRDADQTDGPDPHANLPLEAACLASITLSMSSSAESLHLPMATAPLVRMTQVDWPSLKELSLHGTISPSTASASALITLLRRTPKLHALTIRANRSSDLGPTAILGRLPPRANLPKISLTSLTISFPDPDDAIFDTDTASLVHLALCDMPRTYHTVNGDGLWGHSTRYASGRGIPSATGVLRILRRMDLPRVRTLELVYVADGPEDDELLFYIAGNLPSLSLLELHRYRLDRESCVDYRHICGLLAALSTVRSLRLNLDFEDDDGPYCCLMLFKKWYLKFPGIRSEIIQSLRTCPRLQHVAFLHWFDLEAVWAGYTLSRGDSSMSRFSVTADTKDQYPKDFETRPAGRRTRCMRTIWLASYRGPFT